MNPFILKFVEVANCNKDFNIDFDYNEDLNLSVIRGTNFPVINSSSQQMDTMTQTRAHIEGSDSDPMKLPVSFLIATRTLTEAREATDSDR
jgi:hypothetical protein